MPESPPETRNSTVRTAVAPALENRREEGQAVLARVFTMTILGRTIEHLGTQMYKHRAPSIAELVANSWDAGARSVDVSVPDMGDYKPAESSVLISDDGEGMDEATIQDHYMVVGRNRRASGGAENHGRRVMGRKGIGKLAGFGLAETVAVTTWTAGRPRAVRFSMSLDEFKGEAGRAKNVQFPWEEVEKSPEWPRSGTRIELVGLRHSSPIDVASLKETLARRFSRITRGGMEIRVNGLELPEPELETMVEVPEDGGHMEETLRSGNVVRYRYRFARKPIRSKEMQGFVIYASERTAQAPPFFFNVESTASAQHSTRYVTGEIVADYLDAGLDDESDVISTDRQELDWEKEDLAELREWGEVLARKVLRDCAEARGKEFENWILKDPEFTARLDLLDSPSRREIGGFLKTLGQKSDENDDRARGLADALIRAYEFRTFHDVVDELKEVGEDPERLEEILGRLHDWKALESRAILEIVRGRLGIINKLEQMIVKDAPETASAKTLDNLHDLLAAYPWLFNPEWQVFAEEKSIGRQLQEWGMRDCREDMEKKRVDFLAFAKEEALIVIELKRPGHAVEFEELQRLERYQVELMRSRPNCRRVLVYGGAVNIQEKKWETIRKATDFEELPWSSMFARARRFYSHYEAVLKGDAASEGFRAKQAEVASTRRILETNSAHRSAEVRGRGVGSTDP